MYSEILSTVRTKQELDLLSQEIDLLSASLYKDHGTEFETILEGSVRAKVSAEIKNALSKSQTKKSEFLKGLSAELTKLKVLKLTLAIEPTEKNISKYFQWVEANIGKGVVLDVDFDKKLIAGTIISYQGEYRDYSLKKIFDEKFATKREMTTKSLDTQV